VSFFLVIYILLSITLLDDVSAKDIYSGSRWKHIEKRSLYIVSMSLECIQFGRQNWSSILMTVWLLSLFDITRRTDIIEYSWNEFWMNSVSLASSGYYHWYGWNSILVRVPADIQIDVPADISDAFSNYFSFTSIDSQVQRQLSQLQTIETFQNHKNYNLRWYSFTLIC